MKIQEVEPRLAQELDNPLKQILEASRYFVPENYKAKVFLLDASGRKKKSNSSADNWSPESGRIEIRFEPGRLSEKAKTVAGTKGLAPLSAEPEATVSKVARPVGPAVATTPDLVERLIKALDQAESTPGWHFVSLKRFRDEVLPSEPFPPGAFQPADVHWHEAIRQAIDTRVVLLGKVANPKSPQFPVTTIRLNRLMPEVKAVLGQEESVDLGFHPVEIKGEPLSATIIRERHR